MLRITPDETAVGGDRPGHVTAVNPCLSGGTLEIFLEPVLPAPLVAIFGEGPFSRALADVRGGGGLRRRADLRCRGGAGRRRGRGGVARPGRTGRADRRPQGGRALRGAGGQPPAGQRGAGRHWAKAGGASTRRRASTWGRARRGTWPSPSWPRSSPAGRESRQRLRSWQGGSGRCRRSGVRHDGGHGGGVAAHGARRSTYWFCGPGCHAAFLDHPKHYAQ